MWLGRVLLTLDQVFQSLLLKEPGHSYLKLNKGASMKECRLCHTTKPLSDFRPDARLRGGYRNQCTDCRKIQVRASVRRWQKRHPQEYKEKQALHYRNHRETYKERNAAYYRNNLEKIKQQKASYYQRTAERQRAYKSQYRAAYPERVKATNHRMDLQRRLYISARMQQREQLMKQAPYEEIPLMEIYLRDGGRCQICHKKTLPPTKDNRMKPKSSTRDHIVPLSHPDFISVGHVRTNVRLAHLSCNARRNKRAGDAQYLLFG